MEKRRNLGGNKSFIIHPSSLLTLGAHAQRELLIINPVWVVVGQVSGGQPRAVKGEGGRRRSNALRRKQDLDMRPDPSTRARALSDIILDYTPDLTTWSQSEGSIHSYGLCGHCGHVGFEFCMCLHCDPMPYPLLGQ